MNHENDLIVLTGTDSGIGAELADVFLDKGYMVLATYFRKSKSERAIKIELDLRREESIASIEAKVAELTRNGATLTCLVNNAGVAYGGSIENLPMRLYRENFEVNFFGLVRLTQILIPYLIESQGRIILHGSAAGRTAAPFLSPYVSTKFALEGFADCLRRELLPYDIKVVLLETGGVSTPIWEGFAKQDISFMDKKFDTTMGRFNANFLNGPKGLSSKQAALKIFSVFCRKNPPCRAIIAKSPIRERIIRSLPAKLLDGIFRKMFGMDYGGR